MAELPWFKFNPSSWLSGDIQFCSESAQLLFLKICCLYWKNNCTLTVKVLRKRSGLRALKFSKTLEELKNEDILITNNDNICIEFLDEQYAQRVHISEVNSENAKGDGSTVAQRSSSGRSDSVGHKEGEGELEEEREEEEEEEKKIPLIHHLDFFLDKGCYAPSEESEWFTKTYKQFSDNFLNMVIRICKEQRSSKGLPPKPCRSDLTTELSKQSKKYGDGVLREPKQQESDQ